MVAVCTLCYHVGVINEASSSKLMAMMVESQGLDFLKEICHFIRPRPGYPDAASNLGAVVSLLEKNARLRKKFKETVRQEIKSIKFERPLISAGIVKRGLFSEARRLLTQKLLPAPRESRSLEYFLDQLFTRKKKWRWVPALPNKEWVKLFLLVVDENDLANIPSLDITRAIRVLGQRVSATSLETEVYSKLPDETPFLEFTDYVSRFLSDYKNQPDSTKSFFALSQKIHECRNLITGIREKKRFFGTSIRLTVTSRRLLQQLDRLELLLRILRPQNTEDFSYALVRLFKNLVQGIEEASSLTNLFRQNLDLFAFQVTEFTAKKGEKYTGAGSGDYFHFLFASIAGGCLVAIFAVFKVFLSQLDMALAVKAVLYGLNYSLCFVLIYLTGSVLATKQPAVTASVLARSLDQLNGQAGQLSNVSNLIVLITRNQFISFIGNLVCAFPVAILITYGLEELLGIQATDAAKAKKLLLDNHPWQSGALFYAGIAGLFLFSSGLIQGAVDNWVRYQSVDQRLAEHRWLRFLGNKQAKAADLVAEKIGGITSNTALGFLLGSAGVFGIIWGLPIDIRHIAFSSSHFGIASFDAPGLMTTQTWVVGSLGIAGIGLVNFMVSFGLTLAVTLLSRSVTVRQGGRLVLLLVTHFLTRPWDWFLPTRLESSKQ